MGVEKLINKARKARLSIQKRFNKFKKKTFATYLKLMDSIIKHILLYTCECWGDAFIKKIYLVTSISLFKLRHIYTKLFIKRFIQNI